MNTELQLTREHITALKKADRICFDTDFTSGLEDWRYTNAGIRAIKRTSDAERKRDPFAPDDRTVHVPAVASIRTYGEWSSPYRFKPARAFEMIHGALYHAEWSTITSLLRVGDRLQLCWSSDCNNQLVRDADLHHDQLTLEVERESKNGKVTRLKFMLESSVSKQNEARMIRGSYVRKDEEQAA